MQILSGEWGGGLLICLTPLLPGWTESPPMSPALGDHLAAFSLDCPISSASTQPCQGR